MWWMWLERGYLGLMGSIFLVSGVFSFFDPHAMGAALGIAPIDSSGETEIRATYGGLVVGSGLMLLCGLVSRPMAVGGLVATLFGGGGLVFTRIVMETFLGDPGFALNQAIVVMFELTLIALAFVLLRRALRNSAPARAPQQGGAT